MITLRLVRLLPWIALSLAGSVGASPLNARLFGLDSARAELLKSPLPGGSVEAGPSSRLEFRLRQEPGEHDGLDLLQALLLPGTDQLQHGQWLKGAAMVLVETGVLWLSSDLRRQGDELDRDFKVYADEHWSYERYVAYRQHPGEFAGGSEHENEGYLNRHLSEEDWAGVDTQEELDALFQDSDGDDEFVVGGGQGSHGLPGAYLDGYNVGDPQAWDHFQVSETQQYYEMIGKYAQFQRGWDGYGSDSEWELASDLQVARESWGVHNFCAQTLHYMDMRSESNDKLILADRMLGVLVANHAASFLDVLVQLKKSGPQRLHCRAVPLLSSTGPVSGLGLSWSF